ncbi:cytochrome oxidase maturation protein, cbb3-type [Sphingobacterium nematocida]|uniref:Cytochrome oxidase maturation protein, cbb3-type n=2 Tax=Sphingobacterium nematocida TaxID=1513896 RepID=A0A1T5FR90_9SPHI|nr:cytochrome oxidase maturation protein, cbb3-type [Sphingobacterium nematocida]
MGRREILFNFGIMSIIFFLIGCSVFIALIFLGAFFWANKTGQNDDTYTPSVRILFDDEVKSDGGSESKK